MRLTELTELHENQPDVEIRGLTSDSRQVKSGWLFAALPGTQDDGTRYINEALSNGAVAILAPVGTRILDHRHEYALVTHENPRRHLAHMAEKFFGRQPDYIVAVTGTNGKTSTVDFVRQLWEGLGVKAASLGTLGVRGPGMHKTGSLTTPDPVDLHAELADLAAAGVTHLALEASSHGLHQNRLDGVRVSAAGFTNLTHDHLDYHNTMEDYLIAKAHLFSDLLCVDGVAVLSASVPESKALEGQIKKRGIPVIEYGVDADDINLVSITPKPHGQEIQVDVFGKRYECPVPLVGDFQVMNILCAVGLVIAEDPDNSKRTDKIMSLLPSLKGVRGRLELVSGGKDAAVYVDYAHTPEALRAVLESLRPHTEKRLICVFGCGGNRDRGKRKLMGEISVELADIVFVTDDNPRDEDPGQIRKAILEGARSGREMGDRRQAIGMAVNQLKKGDVLVVAGKGHETGQTVQGKTLPFDDVEEIRKAMEIVMGS